MTDVETHDEAEPVAVHPLVAYLTATRGPWYGFLFALPVLAAYEALEFTFQPDWVNGADAILTRLFAGFGAGTRFQVLLYATLASGLLCYLADRRLRAATGRGPLHYSYFPGMLVESVVYAVLFGGAVNAIQNYVPGLQTGGPGQGALYALTMSLGAGIYEELLFRVIILGGLFVLLRHVAQVPALGSWVLACLVSSAVFSLFHYVGPGGDVFHLDSFFFRFVAGGLLATIYAARGFGIAVWTHALYDVLVMFLHGGL